jgi:hypothetical protein
MPNAKLDILVLNLNSSLLLKVTKIRGSIYTYLSYLKAYYYLSIYINSIFFFINYISSIIIVK